MGTEGFPQNEDCVLPFCGENGNMSGGCCCGQKTLKGFWVTYRPVGSRLLVGYFNDLVPWRWLKTSEWYHGHV